MKKFPGPPRLLGDLLRSLGVEASQFHAVLRGDGSGTQHPNATGFACVIEYQGQAQDAPELRQVVYGALGCGSNMTAELDAYLLALRHLEASGGTRPSRPKIAIVCDNQTIVHQGNKHHRRLANQAGWSVVEYYERLGWSLSWFWAPRNSEVGLEFCDHLSRAARVAMEKASLEVWSRYCGK